MSVTRTETPERFFFLHLQKTAGTAFLFPFRELLPKGSVYPMPEDGNPMTEGPQFKTDLLYRTVAERGDDLRLIIGHFPYCVLEQLPPMTVLTMLRDPVARTLSFLRHYQVLHPETRETPLAAIYDDEFIYRSMIDNHMVKMLGMSIEEMDDGMLSFVDIGQEHLSRAKRNLASIEVVGLQEQFGSFRDAVNSRMGLAIPPHPPINAVPAPPQQAVSAEFRRRIAEDNQWDMALYRFATRLVNRRKWARYARFSALRRLARYSPK